MVIWKDGNYNKIEQTDTSLRAVVYNKETDSTVTTHMTSDRISIKLTVGNNK